MDETEKCQSCGKNEALEEHGCPYKEEINDNYEWKCNCCSECRHECYLDS